MRSRVSDKKRNIIVIVSVVLCILFVAFIVWKMNSLTRNTLNNDDIRANVDCTSVLLISGETDINLISNSAGVPVATLSEIVSSGKEVCIVNLMYSFYNNTGKELDDFSMTVSPIKEKNGKVYYFNDLASETTDGNFSTYTQSIIADKKAISDKYFTDALPAKFEADFKYELSYVMKGQLGVKTLSFTTVKREEE